MKDFGAIVSVYLLVALIFWQAIVLLARTSGRFGLAPDLVPATGIVAIGLLGYASFVIYLASATVGIVCATMVCVGAVVSTIRYRGPGAGFENLAVPYAFAVLFGLLYICLIYAFVPWRLLGLQELFFFEISRPGDNRIPINFADEIYNRFPNIGMIDVGGWYFSDRPPLQAGFALLFRPIRALFGRDETYQGVGTLLQVSVLAGLWILCDALRFRKHETVLAVVTIGGTGFLYYNSIYVWPKLLAATFFLVALVPLGRALLDGRRLTTHETLVLAAAATLAMLSHGAVAFGLIAVSILLVTAVTRFFGVKTFALAVFTAAVLYAPWAGYTTFIEPNENKLLKIHLTDGDHNAPGPFLPVLMKSYRDLTFKKWADDRLANIQELFGSRFVDEVILERTVGMLDPRKRRSDPLDAKTSALDASKLTYDARSLATVLRVDQREFVFRALALLNFGWPLLLLLMSRRWRDTLLDRGLTALIAIDLLTVVVWITLEFSGGYTVITHSSYAMIVIAMLIAVLLLSRTSPRLAHVVCLANVALALAVWVLPGPGPALPRPQGFNWLAILAATLTIGCMIWLIRRILQARPDAAGPVPPRP